MKAMDRDWSDIEHINDDDDSHYPLQLISPSDSEPRRLGCDQRLHTSCILNLMRATLVCFAARRPLLASALGRGALANWEGRANRAADWQFRIPSDLLPGSSGDGKLPGTNVYAI
jgi:hypothetical protein